MLRPWYLAEINKKFTVNPVVALLGPRQCGKTTLAKQYAAENNNKNIAYFDLENPAHLAALNQPLLALSNCTGLIIIDEIQLQPNLFPILRVLVDEHKERKFLILGSASRDLIKQSSETLAGRISYIECTPFGLYEIQDSQNLLFRGGFPRSFLADTDNISVEWRNAYISTFLERDIPNLGFNIPAITMRRFWLMITHYHGQIFNASEVGHAMGIAHTTARHYLDILVGTFMIRELPPWFENIKKRQIKSHKIYFRDSGIYLSLLNIIQPEQIMLHPKLGAIWEGYALEQIIGKHNLPSEHCFFWGVHGQAELDLFIMYKGKKLGFEFKYQDSPRLTRSMQIAFETLNLDELIVIYPGKLKYNLTENIIVTGLDEYIAC